MGIKARQGYVSKPMLKFGFLQQYGLRKCTNSREPVVVFGCYKAPDLRFIQAHRGTIILYWCGNDSWKADLNRVNRPNIIHVTNIPAIQRYLQDKGLTIHLVRMAVREKPKPMIRGKKVYAYLHRGKPEYHGSKVVKQLNGYPILIGDHSIPAREWYAGKADEFYGQSFVGLFLSAYAGGGTSIVEMGVRGIRCVTNVLSMPHTIPWTDVQSVQNAINEQAQYIGKKDTELAWAVYESMVQVNCFDLDKLIIQ